MFARLRSEKASSPLRSDSPVRPKTFKHRLLLEDDEDNDMRPPSPKKHKQGHYSIAPLFDRYKRPRVDEEDQASTRPHGRRQRPSPSPEPDHPLVTELDGKSINSPIPPSPPKPMTPSPEYLQMYTPN
ncbi:hypothetical protein K449DRAFT_13742 [Hypoxylon sp. EC38]|nr:hypothetical protein K449DRAFT_13742 [Hypoxylon sp. EC38]